MISACTALGVVFASLAASTQALRMCTANIKHCYSCTRRCPACQRIQGQLSVFKSSRVQCCEICAVVCPRFRAAEALSIASPIPHRCAQPRALTSLACLKNSYTYSKAVFPVQLWPVSPPLRTPSSNAPFQVLCHLFKRVLGFSLHARYARKYRQKYVKALISPLRHDCVGCVKPLPVC